MGVYRDATEIVRARAAARRAERLAELAATPVGLRSVYVRRAARITGSAAAIMVVMFAAGLALAAIPLDGEPRHNWLSIVLLSAWPVGLSAWLAAALVADRRLRRALADALPPSAEPDQELLLVDTCGPREVEHALAGRRARESWILPLVAATLLVPYTFQLVVIALFFPWETPDAWLCLTGPAAAPVFLYGLVVAWRFPERPDLSRALKGATLWGAFPLLIVSALITLVTALVVMLVAHRPMRAIIARERAAGLAP